MTYIQSKSTLSYTEENTYGQILKTDINVTEDTCDDFISKVILLMKSIGYHDVSIWRSLRDAQDEMTDYFESVEESKKEWEKEAQDEF